MTLPRPGILGLLIASAILLSGSAQAKQADARLQLASQEVPESQLLDVSVRIFREMDAKDRKELEKDKKRFEKEVGKLGKASSGPTGANYVRARLSQIWNAMSSAGSGITLLHCSSLPCSEVRPEPAWMTVALEAVQILTGKF